MSYLKGEFITWLWDESGFFNIPLDCLSFGYEYTHTDEVGNFLGDYTVPYRAKIWVIHAEHEPYSTDSFDVNPNLGNNLQITLPPPIIID